MSIHSYIYPDAQEASAACCRKTLDVLDEVLSGEAFATLAVSGDATAQLLFAELAKTHFTWKSVHLFWVDERGVPPTDEHSKYRLARECFIEPAHFPSRNVHRIQGELQPEAAARLYAEEIREFFSLEPGEFPHFDIMYRTMGPDAHTAGLFPGDPLIDDRENLTAAAYLEASRQWCVTLLPGALLAASHTVMLIAGDDKAEALRSVLNEPYDPKKYPAQISTHHGRSVTWFLDKAAARLME